MPGRLVENVKKMIKPVRDLVFILLGFGYDLYRYYKYAGYYAFIKNRNKRDYKAVKIYHKLEKSLSIRNRNPGSGLGAAVELESLLINGAAQGVLGFQEKVGLAVLCEFYRESSKRDMLPDSLSHLVDSRSKVLEGVAGGAVTKTAAELQGCLDDPEGFFLSRSSIRDFSNRKVEHEQILRGLSLATKTPSVCNRQAWYVYHTDRRELIDSCLSLQNGNTGFGHEIPCLLLISVDINAFDNAGERYQYWIDGGMFSMSIVYALHSLGLGTCCLNWSRTPMDDLRLRKLVPIKPNHTIVMMLAVGYPRESIKVCHSARRPLDSIYEYWS